MPEDFSFDALDLPLPKDLRSRPKKSTTVRIPLATAGISLLVIVIVAWLFLPGQSEKNIANHKPIPLDSNKSERIAIPPVKQPIPPAPVAKREKSPKTEPAEHEAVSRTAPISPPEIESKPLPTPEASNTEEPVPKESPNQSEPKPVPVDSPRPADSESLEKQKTLAVENAIKQGLEWLAHRQQDDGHWAFTVGPNPGSLANSPNCATALALIPLLRAGHTHRDGEHREVVGKGLAFLRNSMIVENNTGRLIEPDSTMYGHAICTIALCEAYGRTKDPKMRRAAQLAVNFIVNSQDPKGGGWRYQPRQGGDTSVLGWQISALSTAKSVKLLVPKLTLDKATEYLNAAQVAGGASYAYQPGGQTQPSTTAVGLLCRIHLGWKKNSPALLRGIAQVSDQGPSLDNMYFNFYATQLMRCAQEDRWPKWQTKICDQFLRAQSTNGETKGSWFFPGGDMGVVRGGRLYFTSLAVMTLQFCQQREKTDKIGR